MIYEPSVLALVIFLLIVGATLGLSFWLGRQAKSAKAYFAAGGGIHWFVNGVAFAGDYLSAASFLGICGMIAFYGYDGFLYSIGYLAGWVVALFVIAEPLKKLGKYTFADALDAKFQSPAIKLTAAVSTLAVSLFYLIPQMVGAGALVKPLLGLPHAAGVIMVGTVVILIVVTAGMVSTTWVQFIKGSLLVVFSAVLVGMILGRGFEVTEPKPTASAAGDWSEVVAGDVWSKLPYARRKNSTTGLIETVRTAEPGQTFEQGIAPAYLVTKKKSDDSLVVNGLPFGKGDGKTQLTPVGQVLTLPEGKTSTGPLGPMEFLSTLSDSTVEIWNSQKVKETNGDETTIHFMTPTKGADVLRPGNHPTFKGVRSEKLFDKLNYLSLMLALFCGTASLPHILIRYYTVKDQTAARKSTIVGIASIGVFYVLTLYIGLGAMTSGSLDLTDSNMAAPLLARSLSEWLFAVISAIAFTTVLGTVSGLIVAASGAVVHDLLASVMKLDLNDHSKVRIAKLASVVVGAIAIVLGILFEKMNVTFLVGWAFSVAASANLPSLIMLLFWKGTTRQGIASGVTVGMVSSLAWILLSGDTYKNVYGLPEADALVPFSQPGIVTIPLGFLTVVLVSLLTAKTARAGSGTGS